MTKLHAFPTDPPTYVAGTDVRVRPTAVIGEGMRFGNDCDVGSYAVVGPGATLGHRVGVGSGSSIAPGMTIDDNVRIGAGACFDGGDGHGASRATHGRVARGSAIGAGAVVGHGVDVGPLSRVQPGAVVVRSVPANAIVEGNPARIVGYVNGMRRSPDFVTTTAAAPSNSYAKITTGVRGVTVHRFPKFADLRGSLTVGLFDSQIPFAPRRFFFVYGVPSAEARGEHAHRECHQFLICTHGSFAVVVDDGFRSEEIALDDCGVGLYMPPLTWGVQYKYSADAVLLVLASHEYDAADYIRDYESFLVEARKVPR